MFDALYLNQAKSKNILKFFVRKHYSAQAIKFTA